MKNEASPIIDPSMRSNRQAQLLLLLSRESLSSAQLVLARHIAASIQDWQGLLLVAARKYTVNFVTTHLKELGVFEGRPQLAQLAQSLCLQAVAQYLRVKASQQKFHETCVLPTKAKCLYMKGVALTERYYNNGSARFCRDIDILCDETSFGRLVRRALDQGYEYFDPDGELIDVNKKEFLEFAIRRLDVVALMGVDGILIEIHRSIEKTTHMFIPQDIFKDAETVSVGCHDLQTMSTEWLFLYICYHHSRHFWSRLHWVSDIAAITGHPLFNEERVRSLAARLGLLPTLEAVLDFGNKAGNPESWSDGSPRCNGDLLLDVCLANLKDDRETEQMLRKDMFLFDMIGDWQLGKGHKHIVWGKSAWRRLRPSVSQYLADPKPRSQEWRYVLQNGLSLLNNVSLHFKVGK